MKPETIDWSGVPAVERNAVCAQFMPKSEVNPILTRHFCVDGKSHGVLAVKDLDEARQWLKRVTEDEVSWRRITDGLPFEWAAKATVTESGHWLRYTDTPGGAWNLIEQLQAEGWGIAMNWHKGTFQTLASRDAVTWSVKGAQKPCELMGALFLLCKGVRVFFPGATIKPFDF